MREIFKLKFILPAVQIILHNFRSLTVFLAIGYWYLIGLAIDNMLVRINYLR